MDEKLKAIEKELEQTRGALHLQTTRCNQLVTSLTGQLQQRDACVRATQQTRDAQLSQIMRALLVLEARLRREQRCIRAQLGSRDALIREQQLEIERLKKMIEPRVDPGSSPPPQRPLSPPDRFRNQPIDSHVKPDLISSLGIWQQSKNNPNHVGLGLDIKDTNADIINPKQRYKKLMNGNSSETSLERTPSSSSSSSTLSSTLSSLSSASTSSFASPSSSILKPTFDDDDDDGLNRNKNQNSIELSVRNRRNSSVDQPERSSIVLDRQNSNKKEEKLEKSVKISDIIQVRTHSDDLSECESADSFTIIHDMKKAAADNMRNGDLESNTKALPPSALLHEMQVQSKTGKNEYHDNPVLECVNQILLRDQEEFLEEQRVLRMRDLEKSHQTQDENLNLISRSQSRDDLTRLPEQNGLSNGNNVTGNRRLMQNNNYNDKPPCLMTSSQLSLLGSVNFDEELNAADVSSREQKSKQLKSVGKRSLIPPALPPKPLRLLSMKPTELSPVEGGIKPKLPPTQTTTKSILNPQKFDLDIRLLESQQPHPIIIGKSSPALPEPNPDSELYVISNSALDDDIVLQIQGRNKKNTVNNNSDVKNVLHSEQKNMNLTHALIHFPSGKKKEKEASPSRTVPDKRKTTPTKNSTSMPVIKVASPVSTLLTSVDNVSAEKPVDKETPPSVSQIVKRFEHLGSDEKLQNTVEEDGNNALQKNFEEFRLDDMDVICASTNEEEDNRLNKEADENEKCLNGSGVDTTTPAVTVAPSEAGVSYENFLEATGLSQKSIMTPSRIFSNNHRNVLKPKDVKHRNRVKAAATISNPTVRYWTEPFL